MRKPLLDQLIANRLQSLWKSLTGFAAYLQEGQDWNAIDPQNPAQPYDTTLMGS